VKKTKKKRKYENVYKDRRKIQMYISINERFGLKTKKKTGKKTKGEWGAGVIFDLIDK